MRRFVLLACVLLAACVHAPGDVWTATEALNARLLASPSATVVLESWCADRRLAPEPRVSARRSAVQKPAPGEVRAALRVDPGEAVAYRQVQLVCGAVVLSEADNWYVPSRLTVGMNRLLGETDTPFGRVVAPLNFTRLRLSSQVLAPRTGQAPAFVLEHRAVLSSAAGDPFSYVVERYTAAAVNTPPG